MNVTNKSNSTNVQHSSSSCKGASGVLQITGSNAVIFTVLEAWLMSPLHCLKLKVFLHWCHIYNIQFMYDYDTIEKQEIFCMLSMLSLRLYAVVPVSCSFFESLLSHHNLQPLCRNSLISSFAPLTLKRTKFPLKFLIKIRSETHVYTEPLTPHRHLLPNNARSVYE